MEREQAGQGEWDDIVQRLGNDLFRDVPDIVATPVEAARTAAPDSQGAPFAHEWDDSEHFVPPRPPAPRWTARTRIAWLCGFSGCGLLVLASLAGFADTWSSVLGAALIATSAAMLFRLIPTHRTDPDDDGAVV